jgi:signal transduction histidine kinase
MNVNLLILIIGVVANTLLGLFVLLRNRHSATTALFFLLTLDMSMWSVANYLTLQYTDLLFVLYLTRIVMALAVPQSLMFFLLMHTLPRPRISLRPLVVWILTIVSVVTSVLCVSPYLFPSIIFVQKTPSPTPGPAMPVFVLVAVGLLLAGVITLVKRIRKSSGIERIQFQVIGLGIVVMFLLIIIFNFLLVVVFSISSFVSVSPLYTLPFVVATAYAIIKHKFLDIRAVVARAVSYTVLISLFGVSYALIFALISSLLIEPTVDMRMVAVSTLAALSMVMTFPGAKKMIEKATDAVFYKDRYDPQKVLYRLSNTMARTLRFEDVTHQFLSQLNTELHIERSCLVIMDNGHLFTIVTEGYDVPPEAPEEAIAMTVKLDMVVRKEESSDSEVKKIMESLDCSMLLPIRTSQKSIGLLGVGRKLSGELLNAEDEGVLSIVAPEVAVAIENALSYEEIHRFNITLEDEVKRATTDLRAANAQLEQLDKLKDEFVSLASHELRTPLTSIRSYIWMALSGKGGVIPDKQKYYLDRAFVSSERLIKLVNDMLNISRIESGRMAIQLDCVHVLTLIQTVLDEVNPKVRELGLRLDVSSEDGIPDVVADADKVEEVLINFIGNAMKFTPRGGRIRINVTRDASFIRISVTDTGIGISPENVGILFTKFGTIHSSALPDAIASQSTGLGLYISKSIISMHGGTVRASSPGIGKGSTFSLTLPVYSKEKQEQLQKQFPSTGLSIIHRTID